MDPEPLRKSIGVRRAAAGVAALAMGVVGVVWLASQDERPATATLPQPVIEQTRVSLAPEAVASAADPGPRAESPGEVQICGGAWVKLGNDGDVDWESVAAVTKQRTEALAAAVLAAMTSSADEQARGVALMMSMTPAVPAHAKPSGCQGNVACERDLASAQVQIAERRDALARLAQTSNDSTLYGWAVHVCKSAVEESSGQCQVIHPAQWARLDPANAAPWVAAAAKAQAEKDPVALNDALYRISVAERYEPSGYKLGSVLLDHVPDSEANLQGTLSLVSQGFGLGVGNGIADAQTLLALCAAKELAEDDVRRDACERSAEMLVKGSTTLTGLMVARGIGKRVGWSEERLDRLQKESGALEAAMVRQTPTGPEVLGCASLRAQFDGIREAAAVGQVAALRRRVAQDAARPLASASVRGVSAMVPPSR